MATDMTMEVVQRAAKAYETSYLFNQEVELAGLTGNTSMNGLRGIARGYHYSTGRRAVYLHGQGKQVSVKPENVKLVDPSTDSNERKLCDLQCRLGTVSLLETIPSNRADVAEFLVNQLGASIDIQDLDDVSARSMAMMGIAELVSPAASIVREAARKQGKVTAKADRRKCANCTKPEPLDNKFPECARCKQVRYCQKECQVAHWKAHHKKECRELASKAEAGVKLERPPSTGMFSATINARTGEKHMLGKDTDGFKKPANVAVGEQFYVKCQGGGPNMPIMIYDETRQCNLSYPPGLAGFEEIRAKIVAEPAFQGRKTYMKASFDSAGVCTVYPTTAALKRW